MGINPCVSGEWPDSHNPYLTRTGSAALSLWLMKLREKAGFPSPVLMEASRMSPGLCTPSTLENIATARGKRHQGE